MKILSKIEEFSAPSESIGLSIGVFDGVHVGHQAVLQRLKQVCDHSVVYTFSNHPADVLHNATIPHLMTLNHRLSILEQIGIDEVILVPFTQELSHKNAHTFLSELKAQIPFSHLILGHDAALGNDKCRNLSPYSQELQFQLEYLQPIIQAAEVISSSTIRKKIQSGDLITAGSYLGRPYSISASVEPGLGKGRELGFHTANLPVGQLALPPSGVWSVHVKIGNEIIPAIANLGHAPTIHHNRPICLEVHLIDDNRDLYGQTLDVIFLRYIRPEKRFPNLDALKHQISQDIQSCQS